MNKLTSTAIVLIALTVIAFYSPLHAAHAQGGGESGVSIDVPYAEGDVLATYGCADYYDAPAQAALLQFTIDGLSAVTGASVVLTLRDGVNFHQINVMEADEVAASDGYVFLYQTAETTTSREIVALPGGQTTKLAQVEVLSQRGDTLALGVVEYDCATGVVSRVVDSFSAE